MDLVEEELVRVWIKMLGIGPTLKNWQVLVEEFGVNVNLRIRWGVAGGGALVCLCFGLHNRKEAALHPNNYKQRRSKVQESAQHPYQRCLLHLPHDPRYTLSRPHNAEVCVDKGEKTKRGR